MLELMPKLVNSSQLTVHRNATTVNRELKTVNCRRRPQGFTLIELLIVITLIGILASLTLVSYSGTQQKARDAVRKSDLNQIRRSLELAKADCQGNAYYPYPPNAAPNTTSITTAVNDYGTTSASGTGTLRGYLTATALKYISSAPLDPQNSSPQAYAYNVGGTSIGSVCPDSAGTALNLWGGTDFLLAVKLERTADADAAKSATSCASKPNIGLFTPTNPGWYFVCNN